jgi:hypothetical protein
MKKLLPFVLLVLASCSNTKSFVMSVDNVNFPFSDPPNVLEVPTSVRAGEAMNIRVSVAGGGCKGFDRFDIKRTPERLELTPIGIERTGAICTTEYSTKWVEYSDPATTPRSTPFKVVVHRANGADLERTVTVSSENFIMNLDNIEFPQPAVKNVLEVPASVMANETIKVRISVALSSGCEQFDSFETKRSNIQLEVTPIGRRPLNVACTGLYGTQWVEFLDVATVPRSNPFKVIVHRANGADLERSVSITP